MGLGARLKPKANLKKVRRRNGQLYIRFPKNKHDLSKVKSLDGCTLESTASTIVQARAPVTWENVDRLLNWKFDCSTFIDDYKNELFPVPIFKKDFTVNGLACTPFGYQAEGIQIIDAWGGICLVADDQGLGKTMQALAWVYWRKALPCLIVCPAFLKKNWETEIKYWLPDHVTTQIISGRQKTEINADFVIINYDILTNSEHDEEEHTKTDELREDLWNFDARTIVPDEAHYISNQESIRGWAVSELAKRCQHRIAITATPGARPIKLFSILNILRPDLFPSFFRYAHKYCGPKKNPFGGGFTFNGSSNEMELHDLLKRAVMLRREKSLIFPDLKKTRRVITFELNNQDEYEEAKNNFVSWCKLNRPHLNRKSAIAEALIKMEVLKQLAVKGRFQDSIDYLWHLLETNDKIVIYCEHKDVVKQLQAEFGEMCVVAVGGISEKKKDAAVTAFQRCAKCGIKKEYHNRDKNACDQYQMDMGKRVFIGSRAAKEGVTLTASWLVVFFELWYTPQDHDQAEDRCFGRAGDKHDADALYLIAADSVEEKVAEIYDLKNQMMNKVMNGRELTREEMLTELIKEAA